MTTMDSQEPAVTIATCLASNKVGGNTLLPYKVRFGGAKFDRGWGQL